VEFRVAAPLIAEGFDTVDQRRNAIRLVRGFLMNDLRRTCQHCGDSFDFDYAWQWQPGHKSYNIRALIDSHRFFCPITRELGRTDYPAWLNRMDYRNITVRMPHELPENALSALDEAKARMFRSFVRIAAGQGRKVVVEQERGKATTDKERKPITTTKRKPPGSTMDEPIMVGCRMRQYPKGGVRRSERPLKIRCRDGHYTAGKAPQEGDEKDSFSEPVGYNYSTHDPKNSAVVATSEMASDSDIEEFAASTSDVEPPLIVSDEEKEPVPKWHEKEIRNPHILLPALDDALKVVEAMAYARPVNYMSPNHWSDDKLLAWLADRPVSGSTIKVVTRQELLAPDAVKHLFDKEDTQWVRWMFPIPDIVGDNEADEYGDGSDPLETTYTHEGSSLQRTLPLMSAHFLMRYWADRTNILRLHSWQNMRRFWFALGIHVRREGRTSLYWGKKKQLNMGWARDEGSPVPEHISRCLRHLRMIGFEHEANIFWGALQRITEDKLVAKPSKRFTGQLTIWRRIMTWQIDVYFATVMEAAIDREDHSKLNPTERRNRRTERVQQYAMQSPFDSPFVTEIDAAHARFAATQRQAGLTPFARQRPKDQWHDGIGELHGPDDVSLYGPRKASDDDIVAPMASGNKRRTSPPLRISSSKKARSTPPSAGESPSLRLSKRRAPKCIRETGDNTESNEEEEDADVDEDSVEEEEDAKVDEDSVEEEGNSDEPAPPLPTSTVELSDDGGSPGESSKPEHENPDGSMDPDRYEDADADADADDEETTSDDSIISLQHEEGGVAKMDIVVELDPSAKPADTAGPRVVVQMPQEAIADVFDGKKVPMDLATTHSPTVSSFLPLPPLDRVEQTLTTGDRPRSGRRPQRSQGRRLPVARAAGTSWE